MVGKEPRELNSVDRHAEVEGDHLRTRGEEAFPKLVVARRDDRVETSRSGSIRQIVGQGRLVVDQQQARLRHELVSPHWGVGGNNA